LTLNVLLSFAQFEREVTGERIRDKVAASKKKGMWMGGYVPLGYDLDKGRLVINQKEADSVRKIFSLYIEIKNVTILYGRLKIAGIRSKVWTSVPGRQFGGAVLSRGTIYHLLGSPIYIGKIIHKGVLHEGQHEAIIDMETWNRVAAQLKQNQVRRRNPHNLPSGRVLYGKLVTPNGQTFTPTHASKKTDVTSTTPLPRPPRSLQRTRYGDCRPLRSRPKLSRVLVPCSKTRCALLVTSSV
jgi:site-specific DNA recombinase